MKQSRIERKLTAARKRAYGVLGVFESLLTELEASVENSLETANAAHAEANKYAGIAKDAEQHALDVQEKLRKIEGVFR